jgi:hypothetical protein
MHRFLILGLAIKLSRFTTDFVNPIFTVCILEREREGGEKESLGPNLEQPQGISFLQTGMEIDMGEVDLVFGFCVYYTKNPEQRRAQQLVIIINFQNIFYNQY